MNWKRISTTVLCLAVICCSNVFAQSQDDGIKQMLKENYQTAASIFNKLIKNDPANGTNYYYLGNCYFELGKNDSAKIANTLGIAANSKEPLPFVGMGQWYLNQNDVGKAKGMFDAALGIASSKDTRTLVAIAQAYTNSDHSNLQEAINTLNKATDINSKDASIYGAMGDVYFTAVENNINLPIANGGGSLGGSAVTNYQRSIDMGKDIARCNTQIGIIWRQSLIYSNSLSSFQAALSADSTFAPAYRELAELYHLTKQDDKANSTYAKYLALADKNDYTEYRSAIFHFLSKDYPGTISILKDLMTRDTSKAVMYRLLGYSYYETGVYPDGLKAMQKFFKKISTDKIIGSDYTYYGKLLSKNSMDSLAVVYYNKAIANDSANCDLRSELATMLYKDNKYLDAAHAWLSDIKCLKDKAGLKEYFELGRSYYYANAFGKADTAFMKAHQLNMSWIQPPLWRARSNAQIDTGMTGTIARDLYDTVIAMGLKDTIKNKSSLSEAYLYFAVYSFKAKKDYKATIDYSNKALSLDPANKTAKALIANAYMSIGYDMMQQKNYQGALDYFNKALTMDPDNKQVKSAIQQLNDYIYKLNHPQQPGQPHQK